jgi:hypothetical protein
MRMGMGNRSTRRKPAPMSLRPPQPTWHELRSKPDPWSKNSTTNRLSYDTINSHFAPGNRLLDDYSLIGLSVLLVTPSYDRNSNLFQDTGETPPKCTTIFLMQDLPWIPTTYVRGSHLWPHVTNYPHNLRVHKAQILWQEIIEFLYYECILFDLFLYWKCGFIY